VNKKITSLHRYALTLSVLGSSNHCQIPKRCKLLLVGSKKLDHGWLVAVFGVFRATDPTQLSRRNSENVQTRRLIKKTGRFFADFSFFSRKSVHSARLALTTLRIRLNSTQLPDELSSVQLSRIGRSEPGLSFTVSSSIAQTTMLACSANSGAQHEQH